jgi:hypothetical protein
MHQNHQAKNSQIIESDIEWDVIIAGGGPAGSVAAAAAAREGAKTLLLEATGCLGGMATSGLVACWCPFSDQEKVIYKGLAEYVFEESKKGIECVKQNQIHGHLPFDPEHIKVVFDDLVTCHGVHVLFNSVVAGVTMKADNELKSVVVANKRGLTSYKARFFIDCTGDADLAYFAGAEYEKGDNLTGSLMPSSLCFLLSNVDDYAYHCSGGTYAGNKNSPIWTIVNSGKYPELDSIHCCSNWVGPGTVDFNANHLFDVDNTNPEMTSKAMMAGRKKAWAMRNALKEYFPEAFGNSHMAATANLLGVRESRRIVGEYSLTLDDYLARRRFDDEICSNCYFIDLHPSKEKNEKCKTFEGWKEYTTSCSEINGIECRYQPGESHGIPYRCLVPKGFKNLLVAGRSISCERRVQSSIRVMPVAMAMGEAAGMAAAKLAALNETHVMNLDIGEFRKALESRWLECLP